MSGGIGRGRIARTVRSRPQWSQPIERAYRAHWVSRTDQRDDSLFVFFFLFLFLFSVWSFRPGLLNDSVGTAGHEAHWKSLRSPARSYLVESNAITSRVVNGEPANRVSEHWTEEIPDCALRPCRTSRVVRRSRSLCILLCRSRLRSSRAGERMA